MSRKDTPFLHCTLVWQTFVGPRHRPLNLHWAYQESSSRTSGVSQYRRFSIFLEPSHTILGSEVTTSSLPRLTFDRTTSDLTLILSSVALRRDSKENVRRDPQTPGLDWTMDENVPEFDSYWENVKIYQLFF